MLTMGMILYHFAHRGEAKAFIAGLNLRPMIGPVEHMYSSDEVMLIITGEGIYASLEKISAVLALFPAITKVINFGISGILNTDKASLNKIYPIASVYGFGADDSVFQSYHSEGKLDCISTHGRVTNFEMANKLRPFAELVDRELWAVARACHLFKRPFASFKLTSDMAGDLNCLDIKNRSDEFSEKLFHFYQNELAEKKTIVGDAELKMELELPFRATYQQALQITKLFEALKLKYQCQHDEILERIDINEVSNSHLSDKIKCNKLIEALQYLLNPIKKEVDQKLANFATALNEIGARVTFDPALEKIEFNLTMTINHQTNIDKLKNSLTSTRFSDFESIMNGELDV